MSEEVVSLRDFNANEDVEAMMSWAGDKDVTRFMMWDTYTSKDQAKEFLENVAIPHGWFKAICLDGNPIGSLTLTRGTGPDRCRAELGYVLRKKDWGKGFATQAVKLALSHGFQELDIERVEALVWVDNKASQKVLQKAGFVQEGLLRKYKFVKGSVRDFLIFSYLRSA